MPRGPAPGPSRLSKILANLKKEPKPQLQNVKALKLTMAQRNDHFGARHFAKDDLPRIRYVNPKLEIEVNKMPKGVADTWKPELVVEFKDGSAKTLNLEGKWSSTIFQEVMDLAGGKNWEQWKQERTEAGLPIMDVPEAKPKEKKTATVDYAALFNSGKTGAAAVLP
ncbi:hypothetical protein C8Q75DRAFT_715513 [Abortiporus biennis]|nr:hypothetical protein C8Q75DRAFT_715513 [Abortiporus biennis]